MLTTLWLVPKKKYTATRVLHAAKSQKIGRIHKYLEFETPHKSLVSTKPTELTTYIEFLKHLASHNITEAEYYKTFELQLGWKNIKQDISKHFSVLIIPDNSLKLVKGEKIKRKEFYKHGGELVKSISIGDAQTYQRIHVKKTKNRDVQIGVTDEDLKFLPDEDENYILTEEVHQDTIQILSTEGFESLLLTGDSGMGKSTAIEQIAFKMNQPVIRENITGSTKVEHLLQEQTIVNKDLVWIDKSLPIAAQKGYWLLIDEISAGQPQVLFMFFRVLEKGYIKLFDGRVINPHPHFKIIFTDNRIGNPNWYKYHGTQQQNTALVNRISSTINYKTLSLEAEKKILVSKTNADKDFAEKIMNFATLLREEAERGSFPDTISTRDLLHISKKYKIFNDYKKALMIAYVNKLQEVDQKNFVINIGQRIFGF